MGLESFRQKGTISWKSTKFRTSGYIIDSGVHCTGRDPVYTGPGTLCILALGPCIWDPTYATLGTPPVPHLLRTGYTADPSLAVDWAMRLKTEPFTQQV